MSHFDICAVSERYKGYCKVIKKLTVIRVKELTADGNSLSKESSVMNKNKRHNQ